MVLSSISYVMYYLIKCIMRPYILLLQTAWFYILYKIHLHAMQRLIIFESHSCDCSTLWYYGQYDQMRHINPFRNLCILPLLASIIMTYQTQAKNNQWPQHVTSWCHRFPQSNLYTGHCIISFCMVYWSGIASIKYCNNCNNK